VSQDMIFLSLTNNSTQFNFAFHFKSQKNLKHATSQGLLLGCNVAGLTQEN